MAPSLWTRGTAQLRGEGHSAICQCALEPPLKSFECLGSDSTLQRERVAHAGPGS